MLNGPLGVCLESAGNVYETDEGNYRVRKISTSGTITTVAGNGAAVYNGDGGPATSAGMVIPSAAQWIKTATFHCGPGRLCGPQGDSGGTITTYAGTGVQGFSGDGCAATQAQLINPTADAVDAAGNLYVTDQFNQRVRMISTTGTITTVAGTGTASYSGDGGPATSAALNYPGGIVVDSAGSLFIVDSVNERIRKVSGGTITTIAGTGATGYAGDGGTALQAQFSNPFAFTADKSGNLYVGDIANNRVREISGAAAHPGPSITSAGVTNAASFQAGIAPGGIVTIFGANLGAPAGQILTSTGNTLQAQVGGTGVTMNAIAAPVYLVLNLNGQEQLSVQAPWALSAASPGLRAQLRAAKW